MPLYEEMHTIARGLRGLSAGQDTSWRKPVIAAGTPVYHGTTTLAAATSIQRKIILQPPGPKARYGEAFYVTTNPGFAASYAGPEGYVVAMRVVDGSRIITPPGVDFRTGETDTSQFSPDAPAGTSAWWEQWWGLKHQAMVEAGLTDEQLRARGHARRQVQRGIDGVAYTLNALTLAIYNPAILEIVRTMPAAEVLGA